MAKWRDLKKAGIRRCCVYYANGRRCTRRVEADVEDIPHAQGRSRSWCVKHANQMESTRKWVERLIANEKEPSR